MTYVPNMIHICPNNLSLWQSVIKPQQTNEHMREVTDAWWRIHMIVEGKMSLSHVVVSL